MRLASIIGTILLTWLDCWAQPDSVASHHKAAAADSSEVRHFRIYYPINQTDIREDYMTNSDNLSVIREFLAASPRIDSLVIYSYASPEGPLAFNRKMAAQRGEAAKQYILRHMQPGTTLPDSVIHLRPEAENWDGLREEVLLHYHGDDRADVLAVLDSSLPDAEKKKRLMKLNGRKAWNYLLRHIMPRLRYATWTTVGAPADPEVLPADTCMADTVQEELKPDTCTRDTLPMLPLTPALPAVQTQRHTLFVVKTNLLYDLASLVNLSAEVPFTIQDKKFSVLYQHHFPWWTWGQNDNEHCIRFLSMGGELRWWFKPGMTEAATRRAGENCLTGWFAGVYGMGGKWDFQWKRDICHQGEFWSAGLSIGYALPIGRWANMEFSLSAGYASIPYRGYTPTDDYSQLLRDPDKQGTWSYFGPTKAEASLVIPINISRTLKGKGGTR